MMSFRDWGAPVAKQDEIKKILDRFLRREAYERPALVRDGDDGDETERDRVYCVLIGSIWELFTGRGVQSSTERVWDIIVDVNMLRAGTVWEFAEAILHCFVPEQQYRVTSTGITWMLHGRYVSNTFADRQYHGKYYTMVMKLRVDGHYCLECIGTHNVRANEDELDGNDTDKDDALANVCTILDALRARISVLESACD